MGSLGDLVTLATLTLTYYVRGIWRLLQPPLPNTNNLWGRRPADWPDPLAPRTSWGLGATKQKLRKQPGTCVHCPELGAITVDSVLARTTPRCLTAPSDQISKQLGLGKVASVLEDSGPPEPLTRTQHRKAFCTPRTRATRNVPRAAVGRLRIG